MPSEISLTGDVLVIGGGLAGCMGAIGAAKRGAKVILADKGWTGATGCSTFAAGDILWFDPAQDNLSQWLNNWLAMGDYMADPEWFEMICKDVHEIVLEMDRWGLPFEKDPDGRFVRKPGRGHNAAVVFPGYKLQQMLRAKAAEAGVTLVDRVMLTSLLDLDGHVAGAAGFNVREGNFYTFRTKTTVLAAGGCSYKGNYYGQDMVCGEGYNLALRVGAEFTNMEFSNVYNSSATEFDIYGMSRFQRLGGRFTNAGGERFMKRYDPVNQDGAHLNILQRAMALEVKAGRGPIYFDLSEMNDENRKLSRKLIPMFFDACESKKIDPFSQRIEWVPGFMGAVCSGSGLTLNGLDCSTTVPGLYAAGDTANEGLAIGGLAGPGGINLSWALVTGWRAGEAAAEDARKLANPAGVPKEEVTKAKTYAFQKMNDGGELEIGQAVIKVQELTIPARFNIIRSAESLKEALAGLEHLEHEIIPKVEVRDYHKLMNYHELLGMLTTANLTYRCALLREESRGSHYREDFPHRDNQNWLKWTRSKCLNGDIRVETVPAPVEKYKLYSIEIPLR